MRKMIKICTVLALLLALGGSLRAVRERHLERQEDFRQAQALESTVKAMEEAERSHQWKLAKWYNHNLAQGTLENGEAYGVVLNFGGGKMALLEVPELGLKLPVFHDGSGGVSHCRETPLPLGGRGEHTVLALCRPYFWEPGMAVYIDCLGKRLAYRVESVQVMAAGWPTERPRTGGQALLTLVYDRGDTRTLIRCVRCETLVLRQRDAVPGLEKLAYGLPLVLLPGLSKGIRRRLRRKQNPRNDGFCLKKQSKPKFF